MSQLNAGHVSSDLFKDHDYGRLECADHGGNCCPAGCHDLTVNQYQHYAALVREWADEWRAG